MNLEILRAIITIAMVLGSATFILAAVRVVFFFGAMVRGQEELTKQATEAAASFREFAVKIENVLEDHEGRIVDLETEQAVRDKLDEERKERRDRDPKAR